MSIIMQTCSTCSTSYFPFREMCPECGGTDFAAAVSHTGVVERSTTLTNGLVLAMLKSDLGPQIISRLHSRTALGSDVELTADPETREGQAYVPQTESVAEKGSHYDS